jgi:ribosomal protein S18 acetylase RimI-like enzyme
MSTVMAMRAACAVGVADNHRGRHQSRLGRCRAARAVGDARGGARGGVRRIARVLASSESGAEATSSGAPAKKPSDGLKPSLVVDLAKGTVKFAPKRRQRNGGELAKDAAVKRMTFEMKDKGNVTIAQLEEEDVDDATNLVMDLFFKVRPQDILAKNRLRGEQAKRVRMGLMDGVKISEDRVLLAAKVGSVLVGIAEVSLPDGNRFGAEKLRPKAPADKPYLSDVAVSPTQRGRGIGRQLVYAAEQAMARMGHTVVYTHTKVDNDAAQALFEKSGYEEPAEVKASLTQAQIAQRSSKNNPFAKLGLVEVGHILLAKQISLDSAP